MIKLIKLYFLKNKAKKLNKEYKPAYNGHYTWVNNNDKEDKNNRDIHYTLLINGNGKRSYKVFNVYNFDLDHKFVHSVLKPWKARYKDFHKEDLFYHKHVIVDGKIIKRKCCANLEYDDINAD